MKRVNAALTLTICVLSLLFAGLACSGNLSVGNNTAGNATTNTSTSTPAPAAPAAAKDIAGNYEAKGTNPDTGNPYEASLLITKRDDVWQFSWDSKGNKYDGVGVMTDSAVAVAYTDGDNGKGCGVVLYTINSDGSLDGKVGYWGENRMETEKATRTSGSDLDGDYSVAGKNPEGQEYKGTLKVKKEGLGYDFTWTAPETLSGFGIRAGNLVAVGFGGKQCAFVGYDIESDGTLNGKWGGRTSKTLGTEVAKPKK